MFPTATISKVLCCFLICYVVLPQHAAKSYSKHTLVNVYFDLVVFTCVAGTS